MENRETRDSKLNREYYVNTNTTASCANDNLNKTNVHEVINYFM